MGGLDIAFNYILDTGRVQYTFITVTPSSTLALSGISHIWVKKNIILINYNSAGPYTKINSKDISTQK